MASVISQARTMQAKPASSSRARSSSSACRRPAVVVRASANNSDGASQLASRAAAAAAAGVMLMAGAQPGIATPLTTTSPMEVAQTADATINRPDPLFSGLLGGSASKQAARAVSDKVSSDVNATQGAFSRGSAQVKQAGRDLQRQAPSLSASSVSDKVSSDVNATQKTLSRGGAQIKQASRDLQRQAPNLDASKAGRSLQRAADRVPNASNIKQAADDLSSKASKSGGGITKAFQNVKDSATDATESIKDNIKSAVDGGLAQGSSNGLVIGRIGGGLEEAVTRAQDAASEATQRLPSSREVSSNIQDAVTPPPVEKVTQGLSKLAEEAKDTAKDATSGLRENIKNASKPSTGLPIAQSGFNNNGLVIGRIGEQLEDAARSASANAQSVTQNLPSAEGVGARIQQAASNLPSLPSGDNVSGKLDSLAREADKASFKSGADLKTVSSSGGQPAASGAGDSIFSKIVGGAQQTVQEAGQKLQKDVAGTNNVLSDVAAADDDAAGKPNKVKGAFSNLLDSLSTKVDASVPDSVPISDTASAKTKDPIGIKSVTTLLKEQAGPNPGPGQGAILDAAQSEPGN